LIGGECNITNLYHGQHAAVLIDLYQAKWWGITLVLMTNKFCVFLFTQFCSCDILIVVYVELS